MQNRVNSIKDLTEINRLLLAFDQYQDGGFINREEILDVMRQSPIISRAMLDHEETLKFCKTAKIIKERYNSIILDSNGKALLQLLKEDNPTNNYDVKGTQAYLLNMNVFLNPELPFPIINIIRTLFDRDEERKTWSYDFNENPPLPEEFLEFVDVLIQSQLLIQGQGFFEINNEYVPEISSLVSTKKRLPAHALSMILEENEIVGQLAEDFVLDYEKKILLENRCRDEADLVKRISEWDVAAGYDIQSFSGPSKNKRYNKFVEVKGSSNKTFRLFWSVNEIKKATELGDKYWLYFLADVHNPDANNLIKIRNPVKEIMKSRRYNKRCIGYEITINDSSENLGSAIS